MWQDNHMARPDNVQIPGISGTPLQAATIDMTVIIKPARTILSSICAIVDGQA